MFVLKVGGSVLQNFENIATDLAGKQFVLVHGFGPQVDRACREIGLEPRWVTSVSGIKSRYTDRETIQICEKVARRLNLSIVKALQNVGVKCSGFLGIYNNLVRAKRKDRIKIVENGRKRIIEGDYTGKIESINSEFLQNLVKRKYSVVISPIALSENNEPLNVNGDRLAANLTKALRIETLLNLSNVPGVLRNGEVIPEIRKPELDKLMQEVSGGMAIKLLGVKEALDFGVREVVIASGEIEKPVSKAFSGQGTVFRNE